MFVRSRAWNREKKTESPTGLELVTFRSLVTSLSKLGSWSIRPLNGCSTITTFSFLPKLRTKSNVWSQHTENGDKIVDRDTLILRCKFWYHEHTDRYTHFKCRMNFDHDAVHLTNFTV